jgi:hypothetical protein
MSSLDGGRDLELEENLKGGRILTGLGRERKSTSHIRNARLMLQEKWLKDIRNEALTSQEKWLKNIYNAALTSQEIG